MVAGAARAVAPRSAVTRLAWVLCLLSILLAVAALFQPARRRIQQAVDHTMRPTATSLWLRPSATGSAPVPPFARTRPG
jgi:hypothetical protein